MWGRRQLWGRVQLVFALVSLAAFYLVGLPWLMTALDVAARWPGATALYPWRWTLLAACPLLFLVGVAFAYRHLQGQVRQQHDRLATSGVSYRLLPRVVEGSARPNPRAGGDLWAQVATLLPARELVSLEVVGQEEDAFFLLRALPATTRALGTQLLADWPGTQLQRLDLDPLVELAAAGYAAWWVEVRPTHAQRPIRPAVTDPGLALLGELVRLRAGVQGGLQVVVRPDPTSPQQMAARAEAKSIPLLNRHNRLYHEVYRQPWESALATASDQREMDEAQGRAQRPFLNAHLVVWATAETRERAHCAAQQLAQVVIAQYGPSNPLVVGSAGAGLPVQRASGLFQGRPWTDEELGTLLHLVGAEGPAAAPGLRVATARTLPPAVTSYPQLTGACLAPEADAQPELIALHLPVN